MVDLNLGYPEQYQAGLTLNLVSYKSVPGVTFKSCDNIHSDESIIHLKIL